MSFLPVQWQAVVDKTRTVRSSLSVAQQLSLAAAFIGVVALVIGSTWYLNQSEYRVLFSDLSAEEASKVVERLAADNVEYRLADDGRTILVPVAASDGLKLQFAGEGLPTSGRIGFEIFDKVAFGQTEFLEHVNYRRALEGELARTIATLSEVKSARVHIAMEKESLFGAKEQPAKASITLMLKGSKPLAPAAGHAITNLVAASVEGLRADQVVIIDSFGRTLARGDGGANDGPMSGAELEKQQRYERDMAMKVVRLLEPVAGLDRVRANVTVRLHGASEEQTREEYDPATVLRSEQVTTEGGGAQAAAQGIAGARGNLPAAVQANGQPDPAASPTTAAAPNAFSKSSKLSNYEVSKTVTHTIRPRGEIAQVSVAVLLDDEHVVSTAQDGTITTKRKPRDGASMQKLQKLVATSLGIDPQRGDQVTVENFTFEAPVAEPVVAPKWWQTVSEQGSGAIKVVAVLLMVAMVLLLVIRPVVNRSLRVTGVGAPSGQALRVGLPHQLPKTIEEIELEIEQQLDQTQGDGDRRQPVLTRRVAKLAEQEPEGAAKLVRSWLNDGKAARS